MSTHNNGTLMYKRKASPAPLFFTNDLHEIRCPLAAAVTPGGRLASVVMTDNNNLRKSNELLISSINN